MLTAQVDAGTLPPVADRLPRQPYVVQPGVLVGENFVELSPGRYGTTLQLAHAQPDSDIDILVANIEPLLWAPGGFSSTSGIEGNVVAGYETNADNSVFTFHLREGLRWSDGQPVTIEDVRFAFEDVLNNPAVTLSYPNYLRTGGRSDGTPGTLAIIDDLTFSVTFDAPYGTFPSQLAGGNALVGYGDFFKPRHFLEQFHEKYADPAMLADLLAEASMSADQWYDLFNQKQLNQIQNITASQHLGHPTLTPWVLAETNAEQVLYTRNAYYFKIDSEGNQLPYLDEIQAPVVLDPETFISRAMFGEFDYAGQERLSLRELPLIAEREEAGELALHVPKALQVPISLQLNLTYPDEVWRQVVTDVRFRRALSLAIDRQQITDTFLLGEFGHPSEIANSPDHDPDEANRLLDEMGLDQRDGDGKRLGPDGTVFTVPFEIFAGTGDRIAIAELVAEFWNEVGVNTTLREIPPETFIELKNDIRATATAHEDPDVWRTGFAETYLPGHSEVPDTRWAPLWRDWYTSGATAGEEPPEEVQEIFRLHEQFVSAEPGSDEQSTAFDGIMESYRSNIWMIIPVEGAQVPTFFSPRMRNVPTGVADDLHNRLVSMSMEQWYVDE